MGFPEVVDVTRNFSVMVRIQGPDPKGLKMRNHAFHLYSSGKTVLSASGMILPASTGLGSSGRSLILTAASVIEPFISQQYRENLSKTWQGKPELVSGVIIDILLEENCKIKGDIDSMAWIPAELLMMVSIPESSAAVQSIISASFGSSDHTWEVGWSAAYNGQPPQQVIENVGAKNVHSSYQGQVETHDANVMGQLTTRLAVLAISSNLSVLLPMLQISVPRRGVPLLAMGSPFGILSPVHFFNNISVGSIANIYPPNSFTKTLLMVDIRCLPGMEGSPVFNEFGQFIGLLTRPLRQKVSGTEIQMVIPWEAVASACSEHLKESFFSSVGVDGESVNLRTLHEHICPSPEISSLVEKATKSVCLIKTENGSWASGVFLNKEGLILTNAHLLEPLRFAKTGPYGDRYEGRSLTDSICNSHGQLERFDCARFGLNEQPSSLEAVNSSLRYENAPFGNGSTRINYQNIRVRLDFMTPWIWTDAKVVFVSKGPLDIALLQLQFSSDQISPISVDVKCPKVGSRAYIIGHGLFGPRCDFLPSACFGVVAKVIESSGSLLTSSHKYSSHDRLPAMLQTTAAVHPGSSGGAVVTSEGHFIGLVTSNAKHGGGKVIPHMNFSIPYAALEPVFNFSKDMEDLSILEKLNQPDEQLSSVWSLAPPLHPRPKREDDAENLKGIKGSRFSKFIADQNELLKLRPQYGADASSTIALLPRSKL